MAVALAPRIIKSVRVSGPAAGDIDRWNDLMRLAEETEVNAVVIDTKDEAGIVFYDTQVTLAHEIGAVRVNYRPDVLLAEVASIQEFVASLPDIDGCSLDADLGHDEFGLPE